METKDILVIFKSGKFYNVYGSDAFIINYLFGYKILKDNKIGFPENIINKVINKLEDCKINYEIVYKDRNSVIKKYDNLNSYNNVLKKAMTYQEIRTRIENIKEKINSIDDINKLDKIIGMLENELC